MAERVCALARHCQLVLAAALLPTCTISAPRPADQTTAAALRFEAGLTSDRAAPRASSAVASAARQVALKVPGFLPALLFVPAGEDSRPLVAAAHGAGGTPEWECDYWARLTSGRAFVLCLRGTPLDRQGSFYFRDHHALAAELAAAVAAARAHSPRIFADSGVYAGFSQGASMGSLMISRYAAQFPYVVLIEGFETWSIARGRSFEQSGGKAVLLVCGTRQCATKADASRRALERAAVRARVEHAPGAGHTPGGSVMTLVARDLPWLFGDDSAWNE